MIRTSSAIVAVAVSAVLAGCGGGDSPTGPPGGGGGGGGDTRQVLADPSFATNIQEIFSRRGCNSGSCHGTAAQEGLQLRNAAESYANLVGISSNQFPQLSRVEPGNVADSYMARKVDPSVGSISGDRMPQGGAALDAIDVSNIKNWITQGAKNN